jgi:hypothetical protein
MLRGASKVAIAGSALAAILAFAAAGCCGGDSSSTTTSTGTDTTATTDNTAGGGDIAAEVASKGTAAAVRDRLKGQVCDSGNRFKTPYIDYKAPVRPYAADKIYYGSWIDPGIEGLDSSGNDKVQNLTPDDLSWYGALDALCNPSTVCQGDACELVEPELYSKIRVEMRMINGQPKISAVFKGMSMGGVNTPLLETAYATFVTTVAGMLPPGSAPAAAPGAPPMDPSKMVPPPPGAPPMDPSKMVPPPGDASKALPPPGATP